RWTRSWRRPGSRWPSRRRCRSPGCRRTRSCGSSARSSTRNRPGSARSPTRRLGGVSTPSPPPEREARMVFGEDAERYDRARPAYPPELVDTLVGWVGAGARVIDVGCGTGKATCLLAERGMVGVGVEAHPAMAAVARTNLAPWPAWRVGEAPLQSWVPGPAAPPPAP